jgi:hypothetical protein
MSEPLKWYDADNPPWIKGLAEAVPGDRDYFLNNPHGIGGGQ